MEQAFIADSTFDKDAFKDKTVTKAEYENCRFLNCDFSNGNLSDFKFTDCEFSGCNLSLAKLVDTVFRDILFKDCKMLGLHFDTCSEFALSFRFENCILNHSSFYKTKIKRTTFRKTQLQEVDFSECDLTESLFDECDLTGASFENTLLEKADFRTAFNYSIDPEMNRIKKARFSVYGLPGLLGKYNIEIDNIK